MEIKFDVFNKADINLIGNAIALNNGVVLQSANIYVKTLIRGYGFYEIPMSFSVEVSVETSYHLLKNGCNAEDIDFKVSNPIDNTTKIYCYSDIEDEEGNVTDLATLVNKAIEMVKDYLLGLRNNIKVVNHPNEYGAYNIAVPMDYVLKEGETLVNE